MPTCPAVPLVGLPPAPGIAGQAGISSGEPNERVRGRTLSTAACRRSAMTVNGAHLRVAAALQRNIVERDLAVRLELGGGTQQVDGTMTEIHTVF